MTAGPFVRELELDCGAAVVVYDDDAPIVGLHVERYNWRLRRARETRGWTRKALAEAAGVDQGKVGDAEKLRRISGDARWKIALALGVPEDVLFPGELDALPDGPETIELSMTRDEMVSVLERDPQGALTDGVEAAALAGDVADALDTLTPRERRVVRLRFGFETGVPLSLAEVGHQFGTTRERIRQIESKALRTLRHRGTAGRLREWYGASRSPRTGTKPSETKPPAGRETDGTICEVWRGPLRRCNDRSPLPDWLLVAPLEELVQPVGWCDPCWGLFLRWRMTHRAGGLPAAFRDDDDGRE